MEVSFQQEDPDQDGGTTKKQASSFESSDFEQAQPKVRPADYWDLYVDGAASQEGSGAGIFLVSPGNDEFKKAVRFKFKASNNQAEYEAVLAGLELAADMDVLAVEIYSDS